MLQDQRFSNTQAGRDLFLSRWKGVQKLRGLKGTTEAVGGGGGGGREGGRSDEGKRKALSFYRP